MAKLMLLGRSSWALGLDVPSDLDIHENLELVDLVDFLELIDFRELMDMAALNLDATLLVLRTL